MLAVSQHAHPVATTTTDSDAAPGAELAGNKATARVLLVLGRVAAAESGSYGVSELSRELGMTKNMVYRALITLERHGFVVRDPSGTRYQLGPGVLRFAGGGLPDLNLPEICAPYMQRMREVSGETVTLAVPSGRMAVTVHGYRGRGVIARRVPLGRVIPLHVSPAARAMLAHFPPDFVDRYADEPLERFTAATITEADALRAELAAIRDRGRATSFGDHWRGGQAVAWALPGSGEFPHGSVTVSGPAERLTDTRLDGFVPELEAIVEELRRHTALYPSDYTGEPSH
jgi:DNA-binding IclR family transcriptional regulator